jgi:hypothetical protein
MARKTQRKCWVTIFWISSGDQLPDSDTTVLIHRPDADEPVWMGYHDGDIWRTVDGGAIAPGQVRDWCDMPKGPE